MLLDTRNKGGIYVGGYLISILQGWGVTHGRELCNASELKGERMEPAF